MSVKLHKPAKGTPDWHNHMNENFDMISGALDDKADLTGPVFTGPVRVNRGVDWGQFIAYSKSGHHRIFEASDNNIRLDVRDTTSTTNRTFFDVHGAVTKPNVFDRLTLVSVTDGVSSAYRVGIIETGLWKPTLAGGSVAGVHTYRIHDGYYYRIGKVVTCTFMLATSKRDAAASGQLRITGLPFRSVNRTNYRACGAADYQYIKLPTGHTQLVGLMMQNVNYMVFPSAGSGLNDRIMTIDAWPDNGLLAATVTYETV